MTDEQFLNRFSCPNSAAAPVFSKYSLTIFAIAVLFCLHGFASGQSLRIVSYNLLDGPTSSSDDQNFRTVIQAIGNQEILGTTRTIDIMAFQEGPSSSSEYDDIEVNFETVFGGNFEATFTPPDFAGCRTGFIYNTATVNLLGSISLTSGFTHNVRRSHFRPVGGTTADEFYIYTIHLKAGSTDSDFSQRESEANLLRTNATSLPASSNIIFCGDLNMKGSFESAFDVLHAPGSNATAFDSLNAPFGFQDNAEWEENLAMQPFHTQNPVNNMDDRFDVLFVNDGLMDGVGIELVVGSATVLGNNGTHAMDSGINTGNGADGFGTQLVAFSDHLPLICDFAVGQIPPSNSQPISANAILTRTVRTSGPVGGAAGDAFLNIEGTDHPGFESFAVVDFDLTGNPTSGSDVQNVVLNMLQSNAGFSTSGPVGVYVATPAAAQVPIDASIQYVAGQDELDCVPSVLSNGAQKVATYASIHRQSNGLTYANGTENPIVLYGLSIGPAISDALAGNGLLRLLIVPDEAGTAATYAGFTSALGASTLTANIVDAGVASTDTFVENLTLAIGVQGIGLLSDLEQSDDVRTRLFSQAQSTNEDVSIEVNFSGSLPTATPDTLSLTIESVVNTPNLLQTVELFDFDVGNWETLDSSVGTLSDNSQTLDAAGDLTRFVGPANAVLARVSWNATGPVVLSPWAVDLDVFKWTTTD